MNFLKQNDSSIGAGLWQRVVTKLSDRITGLLNRVVQIRMMPFDWLPQQIKSKIQKHPKSKVREYVDGQTHVLWKPPIIEGQQWYSHKSLDVVIRFAEAKPMVGYLKTIEILRNHALKK